MLSLFLVQANAQPSATGAPVLELQSTAISVLAVSPNEELVASASAGETVTLWHILANKLIRSLTDGTSPVLSLAFSNRVPNRSIDGQWLAAGCENGQVIVWSMLDGSVLHLLPIANKPIRAVTFSNDSRWLAVGYDNNLRIVDTLNWQLLPATPAVTGGDLATLKFSGDNTWLAAVVEVTAKQTEQKRDENDEEAPPQKTKVVVWKTGSWLARPALDGPDDATSLAFTPGNRLVVAGATNIFEDDKLDSFQLAIWNTANWNVVASPNISVKKFGSLAFSPDGQSMFVEDRDPAQPGQARLRRWKTANWEELAPTFRNVGFLFLPSLIGPSIDGKHVVMRTESGLEVFDPEQPTEKKIILKLIPSAIRLSFSQSGSLLTSAYDGGLIRVWDLKEGRLSRAILVKDKRGLPAEISTLSLSADDRLLAVGTGKPGSLITSGVTLLDLKTSEESPLSRQLNSYDLAQFSPDGRWLVASGSGKLQIWKYADAMLTPIGDSNPTFSGGFGGVQSIAFSPDTHWLAVGDSVNEVHLWELISGEWRERPDNLVGPTDNLSIANLAFSPDLRWLVGGGIGHVLKVWEVGSWKELPELSINAFHTLAFAPNGQLLTSFRRSNRIQQVNIASRQQSVSPLIGHTAPVTAVAVDPLKRWIASSSFDGTVRLWDQRTGKPVVTLVSLGNDGFWGANALAVTPEGLFDGTPESMRQAAWRYDGDKDLGNVFSMSLFFNSLYYPGLLREIFNGRNPASADLVASQAAGIRELRLLVKQNLARFATRNGKSIVCFAEPPSVEDLGIFVNGVQLQIDPEKMTAQDDKSCQYRAELPATVTDKQVELIRLIKNSQPPAQSWNGPRVQTSSANLYVLTVGITEYPENLGYGRLPYSVSDARAIKQFFEAQNSRAGKPFKNIVTFQLYNEDATSDFIRRKFADMSRQIKSEDTVFIYFSGHGAVPPGEAMFYFAPVDADSKRLSQTGFNSAMFAEALRNISARRIVLIIDACQSGGAVESLGRIGELKNALEARMLNENGTGSQETSQQVGVHIISSATPLQEAIQPVDLRQGVMGKVLLDALKGGQISNDGKIYIKDIIDYVNQHLTAQSGQAGQGQIQTAMTKSIGLDFPIAVP